MSMNDNNELASLIILNSIPSLGPIRIKRLLDYFGDATNVLKASLEELITVEGISNNIASSIVRYKEKINPEKEIEVAKKEGIRILTYKDEEYPDVLKHLPDAPSLLYVKGKILKEDFISLSIVGTRKPTNYGKMALEKIINGLANFNITIVSGLAYGIDTMAHELAIKNKLRTIAILGNGLGIFYPLSNKKLQQKIPEHGAVVSEFPYYFRPTKTSFPQRNRIIAAFSLGTLVVEADIKSGALITAKFALELGKDVFAVPGSIFSNQSKGTNYLIKNGAKLVTCAEDIVEEIKELAELIKESTSKKRENKKTNKIDLSEESKKVLEIIKSEPEGIHIDKLQNILNIEITKLMQILFELELNLLIKELPGKIYISI